MRCDWCGASTRGCSGLCRTCKSKCFHACRRIRSEQLIADTAGGSWWIWDAKGAVLVIGKATKYLALKALSLGDEDQEVAQEGETRA
jgi:hypothetical protein